MALIGNIIIGLSTNNAGLNAGLASAKKGVADFGKAATSAGSPVTGVFNSAGAGATNLARSIAAGLGLYNLAATAFTGVKNGIVGAVTGASDLNETLSMTQAILGSSAPAAIKFADEMAAKFGLVKKETLEGAAGIGALGKSLGGLSGGELDAFTTKFTKLAADFQSAKNLGSLKEATDAIGIGLTGEQSDVLKRSGVVVLENTVKEYAYANAIAKRGEALTDQQKLAARAGLIFEGLSFANGDLERTADGAANQFRKFTGGLTNLATSIGTMVLPAVQAAMAGINGMVDRAGAALEANKATFLRWGENLRFVAANAGHIFEIFRLQVVEKLANVAAYAVAFGANLVNIAEYIGRNWSQLIADGVNAAAAAFTNFGSNLGNLGRAIAEFFQDPTKGFQFEWTPLLTGFKATAEKLPELVGPAFVSLQDEIDAQLAVIGENETARSNAMAQGLAPPLAKAVADKGKVDSAAAEKNGPKLAGAVEMGSKEAYSAIVKSKFGGGGDDAKKTADATRKTAENTDRMFRALEKMAGQSGAPVLEIMGI